MQEGRTPLHMVPADDTFRQFLRMTFENEKEDEADESAARSSRAGKVALAETLLEAKADVNLTEKVRRITIA